MPTREEIREGIARKLYYLESDGGYILWADLPDGVKSEYYKKAVEPLETTPVSHRTEI